jgi:hypothetical protein
VEACIGGDECSLFSISALPSSAAGVSLPAVGQAGLHKAYLFRHESPARKVLQSVRGIEPPREALPKAAHVHLSGGER